MDAVGSNKGNDQSSSGDLYSIDNPAIRELLLLEYKTLRDEIFKKMDHRTTLSVSSLTVSSVLLGVGLDRQSREILLVVPMISCLFGLLVAFNNLSINNITDYIRDDLEPRFSCYVPGLLLWHGSQAPRAKRMREIFAVYHLPNILVVLIPVISSVISAWAVLGSLAIGLFLTALDLLLTILYVSRYLRVARGLGNKIGRE